MRKIFGVLIISVFLIQGCASHCGNRGDGITPSTAPSSKRESFSNLMQEIFNLEEYLNKRFVDGDNQAKAKDTYDRLNGGLFRLEIWRVTQHCDIKAQVEALNKLMGPDLPYLATWSSGSPYTYTVGSGGANFHQEFTKQVREIVSSAQWCF